MELAHSVFFLLAGITILIWGANKFVDHSGSIAKHLGISDLAIGLTLVAFGTSAPEIFVGISGVINGNEEIAFGNVIGSNIANIGLIFGVACFYFNAPSKTQLLNFIPFSLSVILLGFSLIDGTISLSESIGFIVLLMIFMYVLLKTKSLDDGEPFKASNINMSMSIIFALIGLIALFVGSGIAIHYAEKTAIFFGVPQIIIGLTIIALGTSLPELATAITALRKGKHQMVVGNIIGSNIFNLVLVIPIIGFFGSININPFVMERDFYILSAMSIIFIILAIALKNRI